MKPNHTLCVIPCSVHSIHLHGHTSSSWPKAMDASQDVVPQLDNKTRRNTINVPNGGYAWIQFQVNNPETLVIHYHIAWHASAGFSLKFVEQRAKITALTEKSRVLPEMNEWCQDWTEHYKRFNIPERKVQEYADLQTSRTWLGSWAGSWQL